MLCNGCYGYILSVYRIKSGTMPDNEKADELGKLLLALVPRNQVQK